MLKHGKKDVLNQLYKSLASIGLGRSLTVYATPKMFDKVFIVAELSANHNGSLENAINTIKSAKRAGADAIKL